MEVIKIELYHEYSRTDKCHNFGIVTENLKESLFVKNYIQWIWFWVGLKLKNKEAKIFPYALGKLVYSYKFCNDASHQGEIIAKKIDSFFKIQNNNSICEVI